MCFDPARAYGRQAIVTHSLQFLRSGLPGIQYWKIQRCFHQVSFLGSRPSKKAGLHIEPLKTNKQIWQIIQIFNTSLKISRCSKVFWVCISNAQSQSQSIDLKQGTECRVPPVLACVTEYTQVAGSCSWFALVTPSPFRYPTEFPLCWHHFGYGAISFQSVEKKISSWHCV